MSGTVEDFDISFHLPSLKHLSSKVNELLGRVNDMAVSQADLDQKIADLKTSVDALIALSSTPPAPAAVDLQPEADAVDALKVEVDAAVAAATPAP
jgi:hypothetical protein